MSIKIASPMIACGKNATFRKQKQSENALSFISINCLESPERIWIYTNLTALRDHSEVGWNYKVGEYAVKKVLHA